MGSKETALWEKELTAYGYYWDTSDEDLGAGSWVGDVDAEDLLVDFLSKHRERYRIDARYTDFFGHNAMCC